MICNQCGTSVEEGTIYCAECGSKLDYVQEDDIPTRPIAAPLETPYAGQTSPISSPRGLQQAEPPAHDTKPLSSPGQERAEQFLSPEQEQPPQFEPQYEPQYAPQLQPEPQPQYAPQPQPQYGPPQGRSNKRNLFIVASAVLLLLVVAGALVLAFKKSSNDPPVVQAIDVDKTTILPGEEVSLIARATDPNDEQLKYEWNSSDGKIVGEGSNVVLNTWGVEPGAEALNVTITLNVTDPAGELASSTRSITIIPESGSTANPLASTMLLKIVADKRAVQRGESVNLRAEVENREAAELSFEWKTSAGTIQSNGNSATLQTSSIQSASTSQQVLVTVTAKDGRGEVKTLSQSINIVESAPKNWPPTVELVASRLRVQQGEEVVISAAASDRDGDPLSYSWSSTAGQLMGTGNKYTLKTSSVNPGQVEVRASVADGRGETATGKLVITVTERPNSSPSVGQIDIDRPRINAGERVQLRANATDPDGDNLSYQWSTSAGTISGNGPNASVDTSGVNPNSGTIQVTVSLTVTDPRGGVATGSRSFVVIGNTRPGPMSASVGKSGEDLIVTLSNDPGRVDSQRGFVQVSVGAFGGGAQATGFFPGAACSVSFGEKENVDEIAFVEAPGPGNRYSRARVRVRPKKPKKPVRFVVIWRAF